VAVISDPSARRPVENAKPFVVRPVGEGQWDVVAWLWQCFRQDLASVVSGLPYADGRYQTQGLGAFPHPDGAGYMAWRPHPNTGEDAPIGFALVNGLTSEQRTLDALWVAPVVRREGVGLQLALDVIARHPGPWAVAFQHENTSAGTFWRRVADAAFGPGRWREDVRQIPGRADLPPDHWIETV
jgi:predicted acetyltransferase